MTNAEIAGAFKMLGKLMELHGDNPFKARSYANAAFRISRLDKPLEGMTADEVKSIEGIGPAISSKINELLTTGSVKLLDKLLQETPDGIMEMLRIKGMGPKKIGELWKKLSIESPVELVYACNENRLVELKGFGQKTQNDFLKKLEYYLSNRDSFHFATAEAEALLITSNLQRTIPGSEAVLTGQLRRKNQIVSKIELLVKLASKKEIRNIEQFKYVKLTSTEDGFYEGKTATGLPITIRFVDEEHFARELFISTGNQSHIDAVQKKMASGNLTCQTEADIYAEAGLAYIEPELREGLNEIQWAETDNLPELVNEEDVKGVIHTHTRYSDGLNSIKEMADYCQEQGYEYMLISDHSQSAFYAGGLKPEEIEKQHAEIEEVSKKLDGFKIFKGIESDILFDGSLDYADDILATFDCVIASIHSNLKMPKEKANERLIKAIENPYTRILGHMTGRLLLSREGYPVDHKKIIDACAQNGVVIELNANPYRLDIDWHYIPYALEKGVMIAVNPDAHSTKGIHDIYYGICVARKGGLTKKMMLNSMTAEAFKNFCQSR